MEDNQSRAAKDLLHHSHLSVVDSEDAFTEFEFALHHISEAFGRWSSELHAFASGEKMPVQDVSVLQVIRMNERPKSAAEIGKFLSRDDNANILYGLRKLEKAGLIEKTAAPLRQTAYQVTERGREVTDRYAAVRRQLLLEQVQSIVGAPDMLERVTRNMWLLSGLYEQAARTVSVMSCLATDAIMPEAAVPARSKAPAAAKGRTSKRSKSAAA